MASRLWNATGHEIKMPAMTTFDLASLAKPLVTAPLALEWLDLDMDRREALAFPRPEALTVRQLLSHSAGLPPWFPFRPGRLADDLAHCQAWGQHPLLVPGCLGAFQYSDLGYRLLAECLEQQTGRPFRELGANHSGLRAAPWIPAPRMVPDGQDAAAWPLACPDWPFPPQKLGWPHDANARAGMQGHAGFAATAEEMRACLERWIAKGYPQRMATDVIQGADGARWGLGLQRALRGGGRFGEVLERLPKGCTGVHVLVDERIEDPKPAPALQAPGAPSDFWLHLAYTGPALFVRPADGLCIALLIHRAGSQGQLLDAEQLRARRWALLERFIANATA